MSHRPISFAVAACLCPLAVGAPVQLQTDSRPSVQRLAEQPTTDASVSLENESVTDQKSGISLRLPKGWTPKQGGQHTSYESPVRDRTTGGGLPPNVVLSRNDAPGIKPANLTALIDEKRAQFAKLYADQEYKETVHEKVSVGGKEGYAIGFAFKYKNVLPLQQKQIWVVTDGKIYIATFMSLQATWDKNDPVFDAMTKTMKIPD